MHVLVFSNCELDPLLGSGRTRLAWSAGLRARGHTVDIVDTGTLLGRDDAGPGRRARMGWQGLRWLQSHDLSAYDLIEFYGAEFWPGTWWLSRRARGRRPLLVAHTDGLELLAAERAAASDAFPRPTGLRAMAASLLQRGETLAFSRADGFVTGCELDRRFLLERRLGPPGHMETVPLGLEPAYLDRPLETAAGREERVVFLGSWIERKGIGTLAAAMTPLLRERPNLQLDLCGTGASEETLRADFPVAVRGRVLAAPRIPNEEMAARLARAQVFFFPSEYEGFGLALAEAMACGCAAVTTPTGFGAELRDGEEALLCPFGAAEAMRAAVARLLDDDALRTRVAGAGWRRAQGLRWETSVGKLEATYRRWLDEKSP